MNVCAVRTIHNTIAESRISPLLENLLWLPHESRSGHRFFLAFDSHKMRLDDNSDDGAGNYAECKHCGSIYAAESGKGE